MRLYLCRRRERMLPLGTFLVVLCFYVYAPCYMAQHFSPSAKVAGYCCFGFFFNIEILFDSFWLHWEFESNLSAWKAEVETWQKASCPLYPMIIDSCSFWFSNINYVLFSLCILTMGAGASVDHPVGNGKQSVYHVSSSVSNLVVL